MIPLHVIPRMWWRHSADGLRCYSCNLIGDPLKCQTTEICGDHKVSSMFISHDVPRWWLEGRYWISDVIIQTKDIACSDKVCLASTCKCFYGGCIHSFYFVSEVIASLGKACLFAIIDGLMMYGVFSFRIFFLYYKTLIFWDW